MSNTSLQELIDGRLKAAEQMAQTLRRIGYVKRGSEEEGFDVDKLAEMARLVLQRWDYEVSKL